MCAQCAQHTSGKVELRLVHIYSLRLLGELVPLLFTLNWHGVLLINTLHWPHLHIWSQDSRHASASLCEQAC